MIFKLKCKSCGNVVSYDTNSNYDPYQTCTGCGQAIRMNIEAKLNNIANMTEFELLGVERDFASTLLREDLTRIELLYEQASPNKQKAMVNILDRLYLMLNRKDNSTYQDIEKILKDYFYHSCEQQVNVFEEYGIQE